MSCLTHTIPPLNLYDTKEWLKLAIKSLFPEIQNELEHRRDNFYNLPFCKKLTDDFLFSITSKVKSLLNPPDKTLTKENDFINMRNKARTINQIPLPSNLNRNNISNIINEDYFVADKSDGLRLLLFGDRDSKKTYLVDRDFNIATISESIFSSFFYSEGDVLLDGELIEPYIRKVTKTSIQNGSTDEIIEDESLGESSNKRKKMKTQFDINSIGNDIENEIKEDGFFTNGMKAPLIFNVFDCIVYKSKELANRSYLERLTGIKNMISDYRNVFHSLPTKDKIIIENKVIVKSSHISYLLKFFSSNFKQNETIFTKKNISYLVDGLIFTPNNCSYIDTHKKVLKWKPQQLQSVDFKLVKQRNKENYLFQVSNKGNDDFVNFCVVNKEEIAFDENDIKDILNKKFSGANDDHIHYNNRTYLKCTNIEEEKIFKKFENKVDRKICEFVYDTKYGVWRFLKVRKDKNKPNHISVVVNTLLTMAENIKLDELIYCFSKKKVN